MYWARICWATVCAIVWPPNWRAAIYWLVAFGISGAAFQPELRRFIDGHFARLFGFAPMTAHYLLAGAFVLILALAVRIALLITKRTRLVGIEAIDCIGYVAINLDFENCGGERLDDIEVQVKIWRLRGRLSGSGHNRFVLISSQELASREQSPAKEINRHRYSIDAGDQKSFRLVNIRTNNEFEFIFETDTLKARGGRYEVECSITHGPTYKIYIVPGTDALEADYCIFTYLRRWRFHQVTTFARCSGLGTEIARKFEFELQQRMKDED